MQTRTIKRQTWLEKVSFEYPGAAIQAAAALLQADGRFKLVECYSDRIIVTFNIIGTGQASASAAGLDMVEQVLTQAGLPMIVIYHLDLEEPEPQPRRYTSARRK